MEKIHTFPTHMQVSPEMTIAGKGVNRESRRPEK